MTSAVLTTSVPSAVPAATCTTSVQTKVPLTGPGTSIDQTLATTLPLTGEPLGGTEHGPVEPCYVADTGDPAAAHSVPSPSNSNSGTAPLLGFKNERRARRSLCWRISARSSPMVGRTPPFSLFDEGYGGARRY